MIAVAVDVFDPADALAAARFRHVSLDVAVPGKDTLF